ncbi:MAG: TetR/AcrR family transcriptional regulator C-terminal domain-containing protein, partial [Gaiellaceae bacterium]
MATDTKPRLPLSRERILHAALELVDEGGIESLTMRKLGQALGFEAMSLYNHVANKDDVIDGILDLVLDESELPSPSGAWDRAVRSSAVSVHGALRRHPWASAVLMAPGRLRPARLRYMDSLLGRLREAGFSAETTYHGYHVLDGHIFGFSLWEASHSY